jgi:hypothetical protein
MDACVPIVGVGMMGPAPAGPDVAGESPPKGSSSIAESVSASTCSCGPLRLLGFCHGYAVVRGYMRPLRGVFLTSARGWILGVPSRRGMAGFLVSGDILLGGPRSAFLLRCPVRPSSAGCFQTDCRTGVCFSGGSGDGVLAVLGESGGPPVWLVTGWDASFLGGAGWYARWEAEEGESPSVLCIAGCWLTLHWSGFFFFFFFFSALRVGRSLVALCGVALPALRVIARPARPPARPRCGWQGMWWPPTYSTVELSSSWI